MGDKLKYYTVDSWHLAQHPAPCCASCLLCKLVQSMVQGKEVPRIRLFAEGAVCCFSSGAI